MIGLGLTLRRRLPARGQDRGTLTMALLVGVIGSGIAAILIPMLVVQIGSTTFANSRTHELNAAETGLSVGLAMMRSAVGADGAGDVTGLPCTPPPLTGTVDESAGAGTYRVSITYYTVNPVDRPDAWLAPYPSGGHGMLCSSGVGPYLPAAAPDAGGVIQRVPGWAVITSTGSDSRASRTLRAIYTVKTTNANITGGTIYLWTAAATRYCMDAGSAPEVGSTVYLQPCATDPLTGTPLPQQTWAYTPDLSIQLVSSVRTSPPNGLCVAAGSPDDDQQRENQKLELAPCQAPGSAPWNQEWSVDDSGHLEGARSDESDINGLCIDAARQAANVALRLQDCAGGTTDPRQTWVPSPDAGSGMAGANAGQSGPTPMQYVNFGAFSHCMDVTNQATGLTNGDGLPGGGSFLIAYTCKQNPNPDQVAWNQKFQYVGGELVTVRDGSRYCVTSPKSIYTDPASGPWVTVTPCPNTPSRETRWWQYDTNSEPVQSAPAGTPPAGADEPWLRYAITDDYGNCLSMTSDSSAAYNGYPKLIVTACHDPAVPNSAPKINMWNATAQVQVPALTHFSEISSP